MNKKPLRIYNHKTPRILMSDAYTIPGFMFESKQAIHKSKYYGVFRRFPHDKLRFVQKEDNRIIFVGLQRIVDRIFRDPLTHHEIDESIEFLKDRKVGTQGFSNFEFPEDLFRKIVDKYNGRFPLVIEGMPEGSVVYPHEPFLRVYNTIDGFGPLASWFESALLRVWAMSARVTAARHWLNYNKNMIRNLEKDDDTYNEELINLLSSTMMHDFGARAASCNQEAEDLGMAHLYCFGGTDTFEGAFQAWKNKAPSHIGSSVWALSHRIVQGYIKESSCYETIYNNAPHNSLISMVSDCYDYYRAVKDYVLPLAIHANKYKNDKVIVVRPDSGKWPKEAIKQILWTLDLAVQNGLYKQKDTNNLKYMTSMRMIISDNMNFDKMMYLNNILIENGYAPHGCLIYGVGGHLRNDISRDDYSTKYALCAYGENFSIPCIKLSEVECKSTLPDSLVLRNPEALESGITIVSPTNKYDKDAMVIYYDGLSSDIYGPGMHDDFNTIKERIDKDFDYMPLNAGKPSEDIKRFCKKIYNEKKNLEYASL